MVVNDDAIRRDAAAESDYRGRYDTMRCKRQWSWRKGARTEGRRVGTEDAIAEAVALAQRTQHSTQSCGIMIVVCGLCEV